MAEKKIKITDLIPNDSNPRTIKEEEFQKLVNSVDGFKKMMRLRPIVVDKKNVIIGGNMRYNALVHLGYKEIPKEWVVKADDLTEEEIKRFIIADNIPFGAWDFDALANEWDVESLTEWGMNKYDFGIPKFEEVDGVQANAELENLESNSNIRMVQLFMTSETQPLFVVMCDKIAELYKTDNLTDTVYEAIKNAYDKIK